ncbi:MAG: alanine--tRNA ligase [Porphyromonadaceae bacterium]|nr:alanine--tRNA ligase [Porphyromonadaceae bacterium]
MLTAKEIRESFKRFFASKQHQIVPSASMVIKDDPTLMFTNAGMNQFKDIILGNVPAKYKRVADSQKCLRVSGKHNDLEEVGLDTYHHTMFEMLGNWSFGDYFKEEAIDWAWEYLIDVLGIDPKRIYATVFEGYAPEGLDRDNEAASYWGKHLPADHIINGNRHDNFWEMGDTGPCGPCSEIHIDLRSEAERANVDALTLVNQGHPQVIEIWNLVFMQYNRKADGSLEPLPAKVIDTGMGFERLCMALQGKTSNYDTDVFQPLIQAIGQLAGKQYGDDSHCDIAMRVIADHVRTIAFSITDGQLPSNAKAGYVIRRILRRAVRYGYTFLHLQQPFLYKLLPTLIDTMGDAYPELIAQRILIEKVIQEEEEAFLRTLSVGIRLLDKVMADARAAGNERISGDDAFILYDTYGFPLDLTELILKENNLKVDIEVFNLRMQEQKERARNAAAVETGDWVVLREGEPHFVGYDLLACDTEILRHRKIRQKNKDYYQLVLSTTPFYAEMGGQVGDTGTLTAENGEVIQILSTKRENNLAVHIVEKLPVEIEGTFFAEVNKENRLATACNHTATHLLHEALREVLGTHVEQKGSFVSPQSLRFDFSHFQKVSDAELREVERRANIKVRACIPLDERRSVPIAEAKAMGAMALFGEKYGDEVRVIRYSSSIELCGGTHVANTGQIGMIHILSEGSTAAGIRRIEAVTAAATETFLESLLDFHNKIRASFNNASDISAAIRRTIEENADLKKQAEEFAKIQVQELKKKILDNVHTINGIKVSKIKMQVLPHLIKNLALQLRGEQQGNFLFVAGTTDPEGKPLLTVALSNDLVAAGLNASTLIRQAAKHIEGGGGGQPHFAQAGGKNAEGLSIAVDEIITEATK